MHAFTASNKEKNIYQISYIVVYSIYEHQSDSIMTYIITYRILKLIFFLHFGDYDTDSTKFV